MKSGQQTLSKTGCYGIDFDNVTFNYTQGGKDALSDVDIHLEPGSLPKSAGETKVEIPVTNVKPGTVAVLVHPDGTEEILKDSVPTEDGIRLTVDGSATVKIVDNSKDFIDTRNHWAKDEINFVASRELFKGVTEEHFGVERTMTRAMVNTVLARLAGVDTTSAAGQNWYDKGVAWARENGVSDGTNPNGNVTREQLATMLYRYAGSPAVNGSLPFSDADTASDYAQNALIWATQNGILNGYGDGRIGPKANAERAGRRHDGAVYPERTVNKPSSHQSSFHKDESEGTYDWILDEFACSHLRLCARPNGL